MTDNTKAKIILDAAKQTADELRAEGKSNLADRTLSAFKDVPVGSLARFYDMLKKFDTKKAALQSLGVDA